MRFALVAAFVVSFFLPTSAMAHIDLTAPTSRYGENEQKYGPCGRAGGERSSNVMYVEPGATIEVQWIETVDHPAHYRIAFDAEGDDDFVDPATMMEMYSNDAVLLDGIEDRDGVDDYYSATVTLPDLTCDDCTLQLIQVMYDKPPYEPGGNDIYYQCADLVLRAGGAPDGGIDPSTGGSNGGSGGGGSAGTGGGCSATGGTLRDFSFWAVILAWAAWRLAQRRRFPV